MSTLTVKIDDESFYKMMISELRESLQCLEENLNQEMPNVFFWEDDIKDKALIRAHIDAFKLVIEWYKT